MITYTPEEKAGYREQFEKGAACTHCGGLHLRACPRVRRIVFKGTDGIAEVEFWKHGRWPTDVIVWPEDVYEDDGGEITGGEAAAEDDADRDQVPGG